MKDGGPAFPQALPDVRLDGLSLSEIAELAIRKRGMSLRDYFAAAALTGILSTSHWPPVAADSAARSAYLFADAMLLARIRKEEAQA